MKLRTVSCNVSTHIWMQDSTVQVQTYVNLQAAAILTQFSACAAKVLSVLSTEELVEAVNPQRMLFFMV